MKIVLVDDHPIILESLGLLLKSLQSVSEIITFDDPHKALDYMEVSSLDLLITDYNMPEMDGCSLAVNIRKFKPNLPIIMLTIADDFDTIKDAFNAGIKGFVMKKANRSELNTAIETVGKGKRYYSEGVMNELLNPANGMSDSIATEDDLPGLTAREIEIVELIGKELSSIEIAERLFLSPATVEKHRHNIIKKLGVKNVIGIVKYAYQHKLIS